MDLSIVQDPILEMCPSLDILQHIVQSTSLDLKVKKAKLSSALLRAASNGDIDMLSWLLDRKAEARPIIAAGSNRTNSRGTPDVSFQELRDEEGSGPVVLATCAGHIDAVTVLIINGAEVDERDASGWTPLMRRGAAKTVHADLASGCGAAEVGADLLSVEFDWKRVRHDQMLVFGSNDLEPLLGMLISNMKPVRAPWTSRAAPANVVFLCARYACFLHDEDLLEELFLGVIDRIEGVIYSHPTDMAFLAFWLSNCCLLHYYMDKDRTLRKSSSVKEYRGLLADLLNEIIVFIIRDAERRIDKVLDAAMLDHEAIPGLEEPRFEGEWKFMKTLAGSVLQFYEINPAIIVQALSQIFFWTGCELFNRVITRKRYLCRSRAIQIRMNVSALEDWARSNALPLSIVHAHISPLSQLISWLQCQSSLQEFDGLIATMQGLKALTPVQMRRVVRDYRYGVGETRMSEECLQYLDQLIIDWKRRQDEQLRQVKEEARLVQERKKRMKKQTSQHQKSGTARQEDYRSESRLLGLQKEEEDGDDDDDDDDDEVMAPADGLDGQMGDASMNSNGTARLAHTEEPLTVAEATACSAQAMIDELFMPGKSMSDYVPPWTAAGPPLGLYDETGGVPGSAPSTPSKGDGLLNSREMLPFALPSRRNALIVTPGDAFGFGRGHFTGTGMPSVRSVNGDSSSSNGGSAASSRRSSIASSSSLRHATSIDGDTTLEQAPRREEDTDLTSDTSSHTDASTTSRTSTLFPTGKGLLAGGYWSPVPLLPDNLLERIDALLKAAAALLPRDRSRNILLADHLSDEHLPLPPSSPPRPTGPVIPPREESILQSPKKESLAFIRPSDSDVVGLKLSLPSRRVFDEDEEGEDMMTPGPNRQTTLKGSPF
uniref:Dilute domain-containing protein n=1 Tax=Kalmanozyma brasiliensis (strain GHG001) TaxID=1365824 RepID=V5F0X0_KALBG